VCREDLAKPAQTLFLHNLTGILETAIRATNAQYDDADILRRLDVRLLEVHYCFLSYEHPQNSTAICQGMVSRTICPV